MSQDYRHSRAFKYSLLPLKMPIWATGNATTDWALTALKEDCGVLIDVSTTIIWGSFQLSKESTDNWQDLMDGMKHWVKVNGIESDEAVFFVRS